MSACKPLTIRCVSPCVRSFRHQTSNFRDKKRGRLVQVISKSTSWPISNEPPQAERIKPHGTRGLIPLVCLCDEEDSYGLAATDSPHKPAWKFLFSVVSTAVWADVCRDLVNRAVKFSNTSRPQSTKLARQGFLSES